MKSDPLLSPLEERDEERGTPDDPSSRRKET